MLINTTIQARNIALNDIVKGIKVTDRKFDQWCVIITGINPIGQIETKEFAKDEWINVQCESTTTRHKIYPTTTTIAINNALANALCNITNRQIKYLCNFTY